MIFVEVRSSIFPLNHKAASMFFFNSLLVALVNPIMLDVGWPPLKRISVGILITPYCRAVSALSSTFTFTKATLPSYSLANSSTSGAIIRQGPHHGAQKSTNTGVFAFKTVSPNFSSLISTGLLIFLLFHFFCYAALNSLFSQSDGVFNCPGLATPMSDDDIAVNTEKVAPPVFTEIKFLRPGTQPDFP